MKLNESGETRVRGVGDHLVGSHIGSRRGEVGQRFTAHLGLSATDRSTRATTRTC